MEYLIEAITNKLRNNAPLASEVGTDGSSEVKVYHSTKPQGRTVAYPYVVFHVFTAGDILKDYSGNRVDRWRVQIDVWSDDHSSRPAAEIMQLVVTAFDECSLDGLAYDEGTPTPSPEPGARTTAGVLQDGSSQIVKDDDSVWHAWTDFIVSLNAA